MPCGSPTSTEPCGNGLVEDGEECDDGVENGPGKACTDECRINHDPDGDGVPDDGDRSGTPGDHPCRSFETDCDDNCPAEPNPEQRDDDADGAGDACERDCPSDVDCDGIVDRLDNCPDVANRDQQDLNVARGQKLGDGIGDACQEGWRIACSAGTWIGDRVDPAIEWGDVWNLLGRSWWSWFPRCRRN